MIIQTIPTPSAALQDEPELPVLPPILTAREVCKIYRTGTHEVEALTSRILMIDRGRIVAEGDLHAVRRRLRDKPHAIRIRLDAPRRLAAKMVGMESVTGVTIPDTDTLVIHTTEPDRVYDRVPELVLADNLRVREIAPADESLEAVFGYLTDQRV